MLWALTAAKGSPGVTTASLALAAATATDPAAGAGEALLVEVDPAGGDLECWCGPHGDPGLLAAVTDVHDAGTADRLWGHAVEVVPGVRALLAPTTGQPVAAALQAASTGFIQAIAGSGGTVIADLGRWISSSPQPAISAIADQASVVVVVCRSTLGSIEHARALVPELQAMNRQVVVLVMGGASPYRPEEISAAVGVPVAGVLPWDPRGVGSLVVQGVSRAWTRSLLARAAGDAWRVLDRVSGRHRVEQA